MNEDGLNYYEFKILLDEDDDSLAFHAYIANKKSYRIVYDLHDIYSDLFKEIKNGDFTVKYINNEEYLSGKDMSYKYFSIKEEDALENLDLFKKEFNKFYSFNVSFQKLNLQPNLGFIFDGPDYSLADGMSPNALLNAAEFQNKMYKLLQTANNIDFGDVFMQQPKAGSIDLNIHTTKQPVLNDVIEFLEKIKAHNIDKQLLFKKNEESDFLKKLVKQLLELEKFDNLKSFTFKVNNQEIKFSKENLNYLFKTYKKLYGEKINYSDAIINYVYKLKDGNTSSLVIDSTKHGTVHCHFKHDESKFKTLLYKSGEKIKIYGQRKSEKTIDLESFEIGNKTEYIFPEIDIHEDEIPF